MERTEILDLMGKLKLFGMNAAFDEIIANGIKRRHEPQRIIGDLLKAELADKAARSIKYQLAIAKLPLAKELTDFQSPPLRANLGHHQSCLWRMAEHIWRRRNTTALLDRLTHHCDIVETGNESWRFKNRDRKPLARYGARGARSVAACSAGVKIGRR